LWRREPVPYNRRTVSDYECSSRAAATLARIVERSADGGQRDWFQAALASARAANDLSALLAAWAGASRRLRATPLRLEAGEADALERSGLRGAAGWTLDRIARSALVCEAARAHDEAAGVIETLFRTADNDERFALLRALPALPRGERFVATATAACRTNVTSVFEAIGCENPYPGEFFGDEAFNQMVIKALFLGVSLARIEGLRTRFNDELARMVAAYASERRAAGRTVPADVDWIMSLEAAAP
jgi:hypothetical protein